MTTTSIPEHLQIAFIGGGNMASAILGGLVRQGMAPARIRVVEPFAGDLDEYAAWLRTRPGSDNPKTPVPKQEPKRVVPAPAPAAPKARINPHKLQKAEERVARLEGKLAECDAQLADPAVYVDAGKVADLGRTQLQLRSELEQAEAELLGLYE